MGRPKLNTEDFIALSKVVHGNKYDYSKSVYVRSNQCLDIICPTHGVFRQRPSSHTTLKQGCAKCNSASNTKSLGKFIEDATSVHGNTYDYSMVTYKRNNIPVDIICKHHGVFHQSPNSHTQGQGCPKCYLENKGKDQIRTTEEFIANAQTTHGDKYGYTKSIYTRAQHKLTITCPTHGDFRQLAYSHTQGQGCPKCIGRGLSTENVIERFRTVHGDRYDYSKTVYVSDSKPITIICSIHGEFAQTPNNHRRGTNCPWCKLQSKGEVLVERWLTANKIDHIQQYKFEDCKYKRKMPFDFYLPNYNILIEYNGQQHYEFVQYIHKSYERFIEQQERDIIKSQYAIDHNILLLTISYKDINKIDSILQQLMQGNK
jgi:hypothetical protein